MSENELQSEIMAALRSIFQENNRPYTDIFLYANQQGEGLNKFAADFCATIDHGHLYMFEVKVLDIDSNELIRFDDEQFKMNCHFSEKLNLPIFYIYNNVKKLTSTNYPKPLDSHINTLYETNFSKPIRLSSKNPSTCNHQKTIDIFNDENNSLSPHDMGFALSFINKATASKNAFVVFIYNSSVNKLMLSMVSEDGLSNLSDLFKKLHAKPGRLNSHDMGVINEYLQGSSHGLDYFTKEAGKVKNKKRNDKNPRP